MARGDRVTITMPMIPEAAYAMLACARLGAIHSVVFGGFSADALRSRIALVPQDAVVFAGTIAENIGFGRPEASAAEIAQAADLALVKETVENAGDA